MVLKELIFHSSSTLGGCGGLVRSMLSNILYFGKV